MKRLVIPLLGKNDAPGTYTVRLIFSRAEGDKPGQRVCDVRVQGTLACPGMDAAAESGSDARCVVREVKNVPVSDNLVIELGARHDSPTSQQMPVLCGLEVERSGLSP